MIGKEILNYVITSYIGKGGMGSVFLAENKYIKQQKVAIKIINADMVNQSTKESLTEEAKKLASLNHQNIVHFINYHIDEDGNIYLVMEYAGGMSLEKYINTKTGLIVEENICKMFEPILDAVETAHKQGIIHRDLKPSNIMIGDDGSPKVLDFGISTLMGMNDNNNSKVMGTPSFMSPEQVKGEPLDARSDIYSLGVILHQMLTGKAPYDITTMTAFEINKKVVEENLPRMQSYYKYISEKLQKVVDKATAKDPKERYNTCGEFKSALHNAVYPPKLPKWSVITIAAVAAVILGCGLYYWDYNRTKVYYYKDYVEQWGVPHGIGKLSKDQTAHLNRMYRMEYSKRLLQRLSHVNSFGNLIVDGESERSERPIDAWFYYTNDKKLNIVKEKDCNGKTLYVKSYNDKLNTVIFQYDDEFGTEKTLGSNTIGYTRALANENVKKGKISRWLLEYDDNGHYKSIKYAGFQNVPVGDENGIYGRSYVRDDKGRVIEEHYLGNDSLPKATKWGLGIKKFYYDENDNWIKSEYLTVNGNPSYDAADGLSVFTLKYDQYGNLIESRHRENNGELMIPKLNGYAGINTIYNEKGLKIKEEMVGIDGKPMSIDGYSSIVSEYDKQGFVSKVTFQDADGKRCYTNLGYSCRMFVNDENGNCLEEWYYDIDDNLVECTKGYAGIKNKYDSQGNVTEIIYCDSENNPIISEGGYAGLAVEYDEYGHDVKITYLDENLKPMTTPDGFAVIKSEYNKSGNMTKISFYDKTGKQLILSSEDIAGWTSKYDENGNEVERAFFDTKGEKCMANSNDYSKWVKKYDDNGNLCEIRYYGIDGNYILYNGVIGEDYVCDERGNVLESKCVGMNGDLADGRLYAKCKYDKYDNQIEYSVYDSKREPALNVLGYQMARYKYDERNNIIEERYFGIDGKLTEYVKSDAEYDHYAIKINEYDKSGRLVRVSLYGKDEKPVECSGKWAAKNLEYDACGNIVRELFFDDAGNPTEPDVKIPEYVKEYDKLGNMTCLAYGDGKGNRIVNENTGVSVIRFAYDKNKRTIKESYFDDKDNPVYFNDKYHAVTYEYDKYDNKCTYRWFGNEDKPIMYGGVYHMVRYKYASDKPLEESYYGLKEEPIMYKGLHRAVTMYDEKGRWAGYECYDIEGNLADSEFGFARQEIYYDDNGGGTKKEYNSKGMLTLAAKWENGTWVRVNTSKWIDEIREISADLPYSEEITVGEVTGKITISHIDIIDRVGRSCEVIFRTTIDKYDIGAENYEEFYVGFMKEFITSLKKMLSSNVTINGVIYDKNGISIRYAY